ncbi:conserved hypothetical protein [Chthoniobacter flavus Ellin428]|uniref:Glycoside hydrolase 123-like N-terminal domain-containing protein n=1 Tax=Chthoniobacter flavus Ellin428 TaxID=497964 RepID=B4CYB0_9BACT|nr:glycoside hydrolase domain-containing protein [Chthoniobacter flavus]EDY20451.1 conserved hypothetical protein [Chthoniobacter flavus Ellin428]TCO85605.1 hypothetical protein EV701_13163 [Chthoniobacter flavus]
MHSRLVSFSLLLTVLTCTENLSFGADTLFRGPEDRVPRGIAKFGTDEWNPIYGNHRAVVEVKEAGDAVLAYLPWRRRDAHPEGKNILVVDAKSGKVIANRVIVTCNKEYGEVAFQPTEGPGQYFLYYLPPVNDGNAFQWPRSSFPITRYPTPTQTASAEWLAKNKLTTDDLRTLPVRRYGQDPVLGGSWRKLPSAELVEFQSLKDATADDWNSFYPMEVISTFAERTQLRDRCRFRPFILFPENRRYPIRMTDQIPYRWAIRDVKELDEFADTAQKNEYYVFQIGVYAFKGTLPHLKTAFTELRSKEGAVIPMEAFTCFNMGGVDQYGKAFTKTVHVAEDRVQPLWFGLDIPKSAQPGVYEGTVTVSADDVAPQEVHLRITVEDKSLADHGDGDAWRLSRLRWLNSRTEIDNDVCAPFPPVTVDGQTVHVLGRDIELAADGFPRQATSHIDMFAIGDTGRAILSSPVHFDVVKDRTPVPLESSTAKCVEKDPGVVRFTASATHGGLREEVDTAVEMDGVIHGKVTLTSDADITLDTVKLTIPISADVATFILGSGAQKPLTSKCPESYQGGLEKHKTTWIGDYNAGLALCLPDDRANWVNLGKGQLRVEHQNGTYALSVETGSLEISKNVPKSFEYDLYVTPIKPLPKQHWDWKYDQPSYGKVPHLNKWDDSHATIFTLHQGNLLNPYINYPFLNAPQLRQVADKIHGAGGLFKAYYTIRELSNRAPELWALRSLGDEILSPSPEHIGYEEMSQLPLEYQFKALTEHPLTGQSWMCEHLVSDYHTRWHSLMDSKRQYQDGSVQISGASRWSNFYIEGLKWLEVNAGLDGLYLDGITFDRASFLRVRKALVRTKPNALIDYHGSPAEVMPQLSCIDSLWFGEGADYSRDPDYWFVAISGIPFGVPGELLQSHASVSKGMVYGLSHRYGWTPADPRGLWGWWDSFKIKDAEMLGYWTPNCPVKIGNPAIRVTAYVHHGKQAAFAIASWSKEETHISPEIDFAALGIDPAKAKLHAPEIPGFQKAAQFEVGKPITLPPDGGLILILESTGQ